MSAAHEGAPAPDFTLPGACGKPFTLKDQRGRPVVVYFYPRDDTPGCTKEACGFARLHPAFKKHGAVIVGISPDTPESHRRFIDKYQLPFDLLSDPDKQVMRTYGAFGEKVLYGKTVTGAIRSSVLIDAEGRVHKHWRRVSKAATHPDSVLKVLDALT